VRRRRRGNWWRKSFFLVIPGRAEGADPESRNSRWTHIWIPGSRASLTPLNDSGLHLTASGARGIDRLQWAAVQVRFPARRKAHDPEKWEPVFG
jgi:hypothetical protein